MTSKNNSQSSTPAAQAAVGELVEKIMGAGEALALLPVTPALEVKPAAAGQEIDPRIELSPTGAEFIGSVSRSRVSALLKEENQAGESAAWRIGDAANYVKKQFGIQVLLELVQELRLDWGTVKTWMWLAGKFPQSMRIDSLTVAHHRVAVRAKEPAKMAEFLKLAVDKGWSASDLAAQINDKKSDPVVDFEVIKPKVQSLDNLVRRDSVTLDADERESLRDDLQELMDYLGEAENFSVKPSKSGKRKSGKRGKHGKRGKKNAQSTVAQGGTPLVAETPAAETGIALVEPAVVPAVAQNKNPVALEQSKALAPSATVIAAMASPVQVMAGMEAPVA